MKTNINAIREALERIVAYGASKFKGDYTSAQLAKEALAALSTIDPEAIRREVCDKLLKAVESVPYSDKKREGASAYDDAIDVCLQTVNAKIAAILGKEVLR